MPLGESMISSLKSNKSIMLDKSKRFKKRLGGYGDRGKTEYNLPKATPKQLEAIKQKLKKDNQLLWIKVTVLSTIIIIGLVLIFLAS